MKGRLNVTKSILVMRSYRWSALTFADGYDEESTDDTEGRHEGCRLVRGGVLVCHEEIVLFFP